MASSKLADLPVSDLNALVAEIEKEFANRKTVWGNRRQVRYRLMDNELRSLPLSNRAGANKALMIFQTEEPNQEVHRRVKRLIANKVRIEAIIYDSNDDQKKLAQDIKDALKALYKWMNRGKVPPERQVVEHQQADGLGVFKLDFIPNYSDNALKFYDADVLELNDDEVGPDEHPQQTKARGAYQAKITKLSAMTNDDGSPKYLPGADLEATAYQQVTNDVRRKCDPPFRLSSIDPLTLFYRMGGDQLEITVEKGKRSINALLESLKGRNVRLVNNHFVEFSTGGDAISPDSVPESEAVGAGFESMVDFVEIRNRQEIVQILRHPKLKSSTKATEDGDYLKIGFKNPFGSYSTGIVLVPGDITGSHDHAHQFQPSILGTLNVAQPLNVLNTIRLSAALDAALRQKYIKAPDVQVQPANDSSRSDKTPGVKDGKAMAMIPGEVKREEAPNVDLDKADERLTEMERESRFNEVLAGDASSSDSGHKLAIQVSQADTQLVPYQNSRAEATVEVLMCCLYAAKSLDQPIYVKEIPDMQMVALGKSDLVQSIRAITPDMFDLDFNLIVTIGSETPVTKFAKWSALDQRYRGGTLSLETLMEQSDVENTDDELGRIFEGQALVGVMQQSIPLIVQSLVQEVMQALQGQTPGGGGGAPGGPSGGEGDQSQAPVGEGGNENGGGAPGAQASTPIAGVGRLPGVGMSPGGPTTGDYGGRVQEGAGDGQAGVG